MEYDNQKPNNLELRSYLEFEYPNGDNVIKVRLPFFENLTIKESKKANYVSYRPISRSSNLYTYTGAESRVLDLDFKLTLDHILTYTANYDKYVLTPLTKSKGALKALFFKNIETTLADGQGKPSLAELKAEYGGDVFGFTEAQTSVKTFNKVESTVPIYKSEQHDLAQVFPALSDLKKSYTKNMDSYKNEIRDTNRRDRAITLVNYWINIIRSSLLNNASNPVFGPPIVRLTHGILYRRIPCICTDYSIMEHDKAGVDVRTLLPKCIVVNMKLEEIRAGNFDKFTTATNGNRDGLPGWESVIEGEHTLDPGRDIHVDQ